MSELYRKLNEIIPSIVKFRVMNVLYRMRFAVNRPLRERYQAVFDAQEEKGIRNIPVYLICYNRVSYLRQMVTSLEAKGCHNIVLVDNHSTYPPLLEYYQSVPYKKIMLDRNWGHMVFWKAPELAPYRQSFYVVSDPDLALTEECPDDFLEVFFHYLRKYPFVNKVGFSIKLDDLPANGVFGEQVIAEEKKFYQTKIERNLYCSSIDTTFALYVPDSIYKQGRFYMGPRTAAPYEVRHLPWYRIKGDVTEEDRYYSAHKITGRWDVAKEAEKQGQ